MKVSSISYSDNAGGAAKAAYRLHQAILQKRGETESTMHVVEKTTGDWSVIQPFGNGFKMLNRIKVKLADYVGQLQKSSNKIIHSFAFFPSRFRLYINEQGADLVHLHWINSEMLSINDIAKIKKPIVWTLHDMWAICGAEHVAYDKRWSEGYSSKNRSLIDRGVDLNKFCWLKKKKKWSKPIQIVAPSRWLAQCVNESALMKGWPVAVIPNPINTQKWTSIDKRVAREILGLPIAKKIIGFGTSFAGDQPHKGRDLLLEALRIFLINNSVQEYEFVIFGDNEPREANDFGFKLNYCGYLNDDISLRVIYSALDVLVIPSRIDNFPNAGVEAHSCGLPVIAFDVCGLKDIVTHMETGYLAKPFDVNDLACGIEWFFSDPYVPKKLSQAARLKATTLWDNEIVASMYIEIYKKVISENANNE